VKAAGSEVLSASPDANVNAPALRILIVDDEELARMRLTALVRQCESPSCQVIGEAAHAAQALQWLQTHTCDLILLDIAMPGPDGMQLAAHLRRQTAALPAVIFVTAHTEHALRAFELEAVDYLTKPVRRERLQAALQRVVQRRNSGSPTPAPALDQPMIVVTDRGNVQRVPVSQALYFKAELKYVTLRTPDHSYILDDSLTELEGRLGPGFIRIHRNALVANKAIRALERRIDYPPQDDPMHPQSEPTTTWAVRVAPVDEWLAVSRRQVTAVREALGLAPKVG
jgi:two-component system, LytTR family, response regulator AlgR